MALRDHHRGDRTLNIGRSVHLTPLNYEDMGLLPEAQFRQPLSPDVLGKLWAASQGVPRLARILADRWWAGGVPSLDVLAELYNPLAVPGLVDPYGRPLSRGSHEEKTIISDVRFVGLTIFCALTGETPLPLGAVKFLPRQAGNFLPALTGRDQQSHDRSEAAMRPRGELPTDGEARRRHCGGWLPVSSRHAIEHRDDVGPRDLGQRLVL